MKKLYLFLTLSSAVMVGCVNDDYVGDNPEGTRTQTGAIEFGLNAPNISRATLVGSKAAEKLNNHFVVYGTKHATAEAATDANDEIVFNQYNVEWTDNSAGTTTTNSHNWEYVGKDSYSTATTSQTVKYWDESAANGYTFYAFSSGDISYPAAPADLVSVEKIKTVATAGAKVYDKGYTVTAKNGASLDNMYYADRKTVAKSEYGKPVVLTFRNFGSRVRVGFYETVPGYSVKINKFYYDDDATGVVTTFKAMNKDNTTNFAASLQNVKTTGQDNQFTVTYYDNTDASVENRAKVTNTTVAYDYTLTLGTGVVNATLAKTSSTPTWDKTDGAYTTVFPFEANTNPMLIRVDYTLTADDGSGETIEVKNARVVVPAQYVQWKSNYTYTYLFKISDNTNGTSGTTPTDPDDPTTGGKEGLFPITFDALVEATTDNMQETVTTVATNSVTTYANGSNVTANHEYKAGEEVRIVVSNTATAGHAVITPSAIGDANGNAQVYTVTAGTGEAVSEATVKAKLTGIENGITLAAINPAATIETTIPMADGTTKSISNVKFAVAAGTKYAYVYTTTKYAAPTYASASAGTYNASTTYYFKTTGNIYYAASGINATNFEANKANLYTQTTAGTAGVYDVKIINVQ